jgi:RHS repeat-associated protein
LNRLASATATNGSWGQGFSYDGFGNLMAKTATAGSPPTMSVSFDPLTYHQYGVSYDANGNVAGLYMGYDVENRQISGGVYGAPESYVYDPSGKRVKKWKQDSEGMLQEEYYFYGVGGQKVLTLTCQQGDLGMLCDPPKYNVYFGGKLVVSKGLAVVTDRLGSVRTNGVGEQMKYYPYGEERTSTADGREKFGTYMRDSATQDYADRRYYAVGMGRFNSPDPSTGSNAADPGSWNKYAYVQGDPINYIDPNGLQRCTQDDDCPAPEEPPENAFGPDQGGKAGTPKRNDPTPARPSPTTASAISKLKTRIGNLGDCTRILGGATSSDLLKVVTGDGQGSTGIQFFASSAESVG